MSQRFLLSLILCLLLTSFASAATYYIDYEGGNDSSNGTSKSTPYKLHPYMKGFSGSYTHQSGDQFIFKGGVVWPNSVFQMRILAGGSSDSVRDYYGADKTWYSGGSWMRPSFDFEHKQIGVGWQTSAAIFVDNSSFITFDNLDIKNFRQILYDTTSGDSDPGFGACSITLFGTTKFVTIQNSIIHDWTLPLPIPSGYIDGGAGEGGVCMVNSNSGGGTGLKILDNVFHQAGVTSKSGLALYLSGEIARNEFHHLSDVLVGSGIVHDNYAHDILDATDPELHEDVFYCTGPCTLYNNIVHDTTPAAPVYYLEPSRSTPTGTTLVYNNIAYNTGYAPVSVDIGSGSGIGHTIKVYNNTLASGLVIRVVNRNNPLGTLELINNHIITSSVAKDIPAGTVNTVIDSNNLIQSFSEASNIGAVIGNRFTPTSTASPTIDTGKNMSSFFTVDMKGVSRPQGGAWDIGAYEFVSGGAPSPINGACGAAAKVYTASETFPSGAYCATTTQPATPANPTSTTPSTWTCAGINGGTNTNCTATRQTATNTPPTISITNPANNSAYTAPANITINATATDDGSITKVEFYNSTTKLAEDLAPPYAYNWSNVAAGTYSITTKATDNAGATTTSLAISITVNAVQDNTAPTISAITASNVTTTSATISWTTNENADTQIEYGTSTSYSQQTALNTTFSTSHSQQLTLLQPNMTYNYKVKSKDTSNNAAQSENQTFTTQPIETTNLTTGLVAHYKFDEGTGTVVTDSSGNANNGTTNGPIWSPGASNSGLNFDGVNDYVSVGTANLPTTDDGTISAWVKIPPSPSGNDTVLAYWSTSSNNWGYYKLILSGGNRPILYNLCSNGGDGICKSDSGITLTPDTWHHITGTFGGLNEYNSGAIYINAELKATGAFDSFYSVASPWALRIGSDVDATDQCKCTIDDVRIYNRTLLASEVHALYNGIATLPAQNAAPSANAGADQNITLPQNTATLQGITADDGLPTGSTLTTAWSKVSSTGTVTFSAPDQPITNATFPVAGTYVLRFTASDGTLNASDDVTIIVKPQPAQFLQKCMNVDANIQQSHKNIHSCPIPTATKFDIKPDFNATDITEMRNFEIGISGAGKITYTDQNINLVKTTNGKEQSANFDEDINITTEKIEINTNNLPMLNTPATITLYNITAQNPIIKKDGATCTECTIISYERNSKTLVFTVPGF